MAQQTIATTGGTAGHGDSGDVVTSKVNANFTELYSYFTAGIPQGGGIKHQRVTTGSINGGASALVTVTWTVAFADANYTPFASVLDSTTAGASLRVVHIESQSGAQLGVRVENTSGGALTGTLNVMAMHD